jgi:hypothetical protein
MEILVRHFALAYSFKRLNYEIVILISPVRTQIIYNDQITEIGEAT